MQLKHNGCFEILKRLYDTGLPPDPVASDRHDRIRWRGIIASVVAVGSVNATPLRIRPTNAA
jgi:hypothetical protein